MKQLCHILVTGAAGFIGSNFSRIALDKNFSVIGLDKLTYSGRWETIEKLQLYKNFQFIKCDIGNHDWIEQFQRLNYKIKLSAIINFASETHLDRSIDSPDLFFETNVVGTQKLIMLLMKSDICTTDFRFIHISTDEVFGSLDTGKFTETSPYMPNSPYAASKASADHVVRAAVNTYGFPAIITNCSNNFGPFQFPEKLIPLILIRALNEKNLPVYGDGLQVRDWLYVDDHCEAILEVLKKGIIGESYLIGANNQIENITVVEAICNILDELKPRKGNQTYRDLISFVTDRPGHDQRYAVDPSKIEQKIGWKAKTKFEEGLRKTISWYLDNHDWWNSIYKDNYNLSRLGLPKNIRWKEK